MKPKTPAGWPCPLDQDQAFREGVAVAQAHGLDTAGEHTHAHAAAWAVHLHGGGVTNDRRTLTATERYRFEREAARIVAERQGRDRDAADLKRAVEGMDKAIARQLTFIEAAGDAEKFDQVAKKACLDRLVDEVNQAQGALAPYAAMGPRLPAELRPKLRELQDACDKADREMEDARKDFEAGRVELHRLGAVARDEAITARAALARVQITIATGIGKEARALILPDQALYKKRPERAPDALFPLWREAMQINGIVQRLANDPVAVLAALERGAGDTFEILSAKCEDSREAGADPMQRRTPNTDGLLSMTF